MKVCPVCGHENDDNAEQCEKCGAPLIEPTEVKKKSDNDSPENPTGLGQESEREILGGRFILLEKIGAGGMGEVYMARDITLDTIVAVKIIRKELLSSEEARERFRIEINNTREISDPHVVKIFDSGVDPEKGYYFAMEYIEGVTLESIIRRKAPLDIEEGEDIVIGICKALKAAHSKGIIHRDLKPSNILVDDDNIPHVFDFGISRALEGRRERLTKSGHVVGTLPYMSPEQLAGKEIDTRSDIYSLGVIMYEMFTGRLPFKKNLVKLVTKRYRERPTPPKKLNPEIPDYLNKIIMKCLKVKPENRFNDVDEIIFAIQNKSLTTEGITRTTPWRTAKKTFYHAFLFVLFLLLLVNLYLIGPGGLKVHQYRLQRITYSPFIEMMPSLSPFSSRLAFSSNEGGNFDIMVETVGEGSYLNLTQDHKGLDGEPSWSPDGRKIVFYSDREGGGLFLIPSLGGTVRKISSFGHNPRFSHNGKYLTFEAVPENSDFSKIFVLDLTTGEVREVSSLAPRFANHNYPSWSPDDKYVIFSTSNGEIFIVSRDGKFTQKLYEEERKEIKYPFWTKNNEIYFISNRNGVHDIWMLKIRKWWKKFYVVGSAVPVTVYAQVNSLYVSDDGGKIVFTDLKEEKGIYELNVYTRRVRPIIQPTGGKYYAPQISHDGRKLAYISDKTGLPQLWIKDLRTGKEIQLTQDWNEKRWPTWSPDDKYIAYCSFGSGNGDIYVIPASGGIPRRITYSSDYEGAPDWSPDGKWLLVNVRIKNLFKIAKIKLNRPTHRIYLATGPGNQYDPRWSPDGNLILFVQNGNIVVTDKKGSSKKKLIKGFSPVFSSGARYIYFLREGDIWRIRFNRATMSVVGNPERLTKFSSSTLEVDPSWKFSLIQGRLYFSLRRIKNSDVILMEKIK